ncbi:ATP-binding cassette domain-containing protein, partial [Streptococcus danieliae]|nr:ATP-binding cassette domain-containing protein [Streptococcus danieliae]
VLAIVGESGCGKSTLATSIMGLHNEKQAKVTGSIKYRGTELVGTKSQQLEQIRGKQIGMIFQDPLSALNPLMRVEDQIKESLD